MKTFLTHNSEDKQSYLNMVSQVSSAVINAITDDKAYSGPTPQQN